MLYPAIQQAFHFPLTIQEMVTSILVATLCGTLLAVFYQRVQRGVNYSPSIVKSIIMLCIITSFVMMVIGDNLARAFGMVALISLIRFRTTVKGAQDFMFIYLALAIGVSAGVGLYAVTLAGTLLIIAITWVMTLFHAGSNQQHEFTLRITSDSETGHERQVEATLAKFCRKYRLHLSKLEVKEKLSTTILDYYVMLKPGQEAGHLIGELQASGGLVISLHYVEG